MVFIYEEESMSTPLERVFEAADCRTQEQLASLLGIRQSAVSDAKRRKSVPPEWLVCLFRLRGVNPEWVLTGYGPKFLNKESGSDSSTQWEKKIKATPELLRMFSSKDLADELVRRSSSSSSAHTRKQTA